MIKSRVVFACCALFLVGGAAVLWLLPVWKSASAFDGHPVHWESSNSLILMREQTLVRWQMDTGEEATIFDLMTLDGSPFDFPPEHACFSDSKGLIPFYGRRESGIVRYGRLIYSRDTGTVSVEHFPSGAATGPILINYGPACGEPYNLDGEVDTVAGTVPNPEPNWDDIPGERKPTLFKPAEARQVLVGADFGSLSIVYSMFGERKHIVLKGTRPNVNSSSTSEQWNGRWADGELPISIRDRSSSGKYLIHEAPRANSKRVWVVSLDETIVKEIDLPEGPWAAEKGGSIFSCGACGCDCYRHQKFYYAGGKMFIFIWGEEYSDGVQGIYQLVEGSEGPTWWQKLQGTFRFPLAFSPDGCRVAVFEDQGDIRQLCD